MVEIAELAKTIAKLAVPGMRPKQLIQATREVHPDASKKEITRAAFYAVLEMVEMAPDDASHIHALAMDTRNSLDEAGEIEAPKE